MKERNHRAAAALRDLGFEPRQIRRGLIAMNGIAATGSARVSEGSLFGALKQAEAGSLAARKMLAEALHVDAGALFPDG